MTDKRVMVAVHDGNPLIDSAYFVRTDQTIDFLARFPNVEFIAIPCHDVTDIDFRLEF